MGGDGAMMEFYQRACQIKADTGACLLIVIGGRRLVEPFEYLVELVLGNLFAIISNGDGGTLGVVSEADAYLTTRRCVLEGIGEHIHHHLVEVGTIDPHWQGVCIVIKAQLDALRLGLRLEEGIDILDEGYQIGLAHAHLHLPLVDLPEVHHLIDETQDALRITTDGLIDTLALRIVLVLDEGEQRGEDERHRRADIVTDVHEETETGFTHLLGMNMGLEAQAVLLTVTTVEQILPDEEADDQRIEEIGPSRTVPRRMDHDGELAHGCLLLIVLGLHTETVGALRKMREGEDIGAWLQADKGLAIDAIEIGDMFGILVGQRGETDGKGVVVITQFEMIAGHDGRIGDNIVARTALLDDLLAIDGEGRQLYAGIPLTGNDVLGREPGDTASTTKEDQTVAIDTRGAITELIALQTVVDEEIAETPLFGIETTQAVVGGYPQLACSIFFDRAHTVVGQTFVTGIVMELLSMKVIAIETLVGTCPELTAVLARYTHGRTII